MATGSEIFLTQQQHSELSSIAQSRTLPAGYVFRAKLILMLAEGVSFSTPTIDSLFQQMPCQYVLTPLQILKDPFWLSRRGAGLLIQTCQKPSEFGLCKSHGYCT